MGKLYAIEGGQLDALRALAKRLYSERRMNGDDMRNAAQTLDSIIRIVSQIEIPESQHCSDCGCHMLETCNH